MQRETCPNCDGSGITKHNERCLVCDGSGKIEIPELKRCYKHGGIHEYEGDKCPVCLDQEQHGGDID